MKLLVIADDFTGALDTGVQFSRFGINTIVTMDSAVDLSGIPAEVQALVADTESRHLPPGEAANRVGMISKAAAARGIPYIYKKTDSTLRGNIGAELKAVMDAHGGSPAIFVPAFPAAGRTTVNGRQFVNGMPLEQTAFAHDPLNPMNTSVIAGILRSQADLQVQNVHRGSTLNTFDEPNTVYVFDGETDEDLRRAARLVQKADRLHITAGCAGFALYLAQRLPLEHSMPEQPKLPGNILLVCGSVNERSLLQLEHAEALGYAKMTPEAAQLTDASYWSTTDGRAAVDKAAGLLNSKGRLAIQSAKSGGERLPAGQSTAIAKSLGRLAAGIVRQAKPCTLVVFGGDTAMGVMAEAGCTGLMPMQEIEPGVALSAMQSPLGRTFLVSKAGGLGSENTLEKIDQTIRGNKK